MPLDSTQQQRILDAVFRGPMAELIGEVVRRTLAPRKRNEDDKDYATRTNSRLKAIKFEIPFDDQSPKRDLRCRPTWDDCSRLATIGNTAGIGLSRALHHAVRIGHHVFQTVMAEIMDTSERTGASVRDLLTTASSGNGVCLPPEADGNRSAETPAAAPAVSVAAVAQPPADAERDTPLVAHTSGQTSTALSIPLHLMATRAAVPPSRENVTEERIEELEDRIQRLQETMDVLIESIDAFRDDLVHTLRNLPDQLPRPVHIHSLPLDPTDSDFAERVNAIPQEVMARLREEAGRAKRGEPAVATAAEGNPSPAPVVNETIGGTEPRRQSRQGKLFG